METCCMEYVKELRMLEVVLNGSFAVAGWCLSMSGEGAGGGSVWASRCSGSFMGVVPGLRP